MHKTVVIFKSSHFNAYMLKLELQQKHIKTVFSEEKIFYFCFTSNVRVQSSVCLEETRCLTGNRCVKSKGLQAGELFAPGLLHTVTEDVLPGVQLQQLDAAQQLIGLL